MPGPYVHHLDPIVTTLAGVHIWWYGVGYAAGFAEMLVFLLGTRHTLGLSRRDVYALVLFVAIGVLVGGRAIEVSFDEWPFYRDHPQLIPALWLGGMATHGLLLGAAAGLALYSYVSRKPLLETADALVIAGAFLMGVGRLGNFVDGQIVGHNDKTGHYQTRKNLYQSGMPAEKFHPFTEDPRDWYKVK